MESLKSLAAAFAIEGRVASVEPLGSGLINDTYIVHTAGAGTPDYVLQRLNNNVFRDIDALQRNLVKITAHIRRRLRAEGVADTHRRVLTHVPVADGRLWLRDDQGGCWRMTVHIPGSVTLEKVDALTARRTGEAFGRFHSYFTGTDVPHLEETIPNFHNTAFRVEQLRQAVATDPCGRVAETREIIDELLELASGMCRLNQLEAEGKLLKRVTHCDTKLNNVLFDSDGEILCVIDLDTTMPGYVMSDFGDFLRTAANTAAEDEPDTSLVSFDMDIYHAFSEGYLSTATFLTPLERELLPFGAEMLTYMQTVRFLTDYLQGDTYYKTAYPGHNLIRTRSQLALLHSMFACLGQNR